MSNHVSTRVPCYLDDEEEFYTEMQANRLTAILGHDPSGPIATITGDPEDIVAWLVQNGYEISDIVWRATC